MKILAVTKGRDFRFFSLIKPLQCINAEVGFLGSDDQEEIEKFKPDLLIHNVRGLEYSGEALELNLNIQPFIDATYSRRGEVAKQHRSDICYVGSVDDFGDSIKGFLTQDYIVKIFHQVPSGGGFYCGMLNIEEAYKVYRGSKCSLIPDKDAGYRELDIIVSGGNPVPYDSEHGRFILEIRGAIGGQIRKGSYTKEEILNKHTNFDRLSDILKKDGRKKLAKEIMKKKNENIRNC